MSNTAKSPLRKALLETATDLIRILGYCLLIVFGLSFFFEVPINPAIPLSTFGILTAGVALIILATVIKLISLSDKFAARE
jgi:predicted acyltransferase